MGDTAMAEALRGSEVRYRRLFEAAQYGILILDSLTGLITDANPYLIGLLNCSHEEFVRKAFWEIGLFKDPEAARAAFAELQANVYVRYEDVPLKTTAERPISVEVISDAYTEKGESVIQCKIRNITQQKYAEQSGKRLLQAQRMEAVGPSEGPCLEPTEISRGRSILDLEIKISPRFRVMVHRSKAFTMSVEPV